MNIGGRVGTWTEVERAKLAELAAAGLSGSQIAKEMLRSRNSVLGEAYRLGVHMTPKHDSRWTKSLGLGAWVLAEQGFPTDVIAQRLGNGFSARDVRVKLWNMKAQRQKQALRQQRYEARKPLERRRAPRPVAAPVDATSSRVRLVDLEWWHCRYPLAKINEPVEFYCGLPVEREQSWCPYHCRVCFSPSRHSVVHA